MVSPVENKVQKTWVWDASVRVGHWLLAICFATAYATGESESWRLWHIYSGSGVLGVVGYRVVWGVIGTPHARFNAFVRPPSHALRYLKSLLTGKPEHHTGHNPAGGWAVIGLLGLSALTAITGWFIYQGKPPRWLEKSHELSANLTLLLVAVHVLAVVISSKLHSDNLIKAMVTGNKPALLNMPREPRFRHGQVVLGLSILAFCLTLAYCAVVFWN
jgi:cytochrome b